MAVELKKDEAKKDLEKMMAKPRAEAQRTKEAHMSEEERKAKEKADAEAKKKREEAEVKAKKDAEILKKKDEELSDEDKKRKTELLDEQKRKEDAKLSPEIKKIKEETQKRIDEISNNLLQLKDKSSKEADELRRQLQTVQDEKVVLEKKLSTAPAEDEIESSVEKEEGERIAKYLKEDAELSKEKRREMTKEELDEWLLEDLGSAQAWLTRREFRRERERQQSRYTKQYEKNIKTLMTKQQESTKRAWAKHPELDVTKREAELKAEGKSAEEIHQILCKENEKHRICCELLVKNSQKYMSVENGPELLTADMEKQLNTAPPTDEKQTQIDDLTKKVEDLTATLQQLQTSDVGINSTITRKPPEGELTDAQKLFVKTAKDMKLPQERIDAKLKEMRQEGK